MGFAIFFIVSLFLSFFLQAVSFIIRQMETTGAFLRIALKLARSRSFHGHVDRRPHQSPAPHPSLSNVVIISSHLERYLNLCSALLSSALAVTSLKC